jgi:hypothetical protein
MRRDALVGRKLDALDHRLGLGRVPDYDGEVDSWKDGVVFPTVTDPSPAAP